MSRSRASGVSCRLYARQRSATASPRSSGTGMRGVVDGAEAFARQVRVDLGGREIGVAEQLLHGAEVRTSLEQMGGVRVSERVRMERLPVGQRVTGDEAAGVTGGETPAPGVEEHGIGRSPLGHETGPAVREVPA